LLVLLFMAPHGRRYPLLALLLMLAALAYGWWRLESEPPDPLPQGSGSFAVLFAEGNIDQNQKWLPAFQRSTVQTYLRLTEEMLAAHPGEHPLIIWPETALPFNLMAANPHTPRIRELAARARCPLLTGAPGFEGSRADMRVYNRAYLIGPDGSLAGYYDKEHLVPFGEYVPDWLQWNFLEGLLQQVGVYTPGTRLSPLRSSGLELGMLICYEGIFPWLAQQRVRDGANVLVDISNDGWFGRSPAALQHLRLTAVRAVEQNRWILRGTNTGISAVIDARGRVVLRGGQFEEAARWGRARILSETTPYHRIARWLPAAAALLLLGLLFFGPVRRNF
uniref:apolipoprotein N-acyltransferase n=1 Tax=uncultured Desulfovibrio sp. TaxID=167968 RepID=UPI003207ECF8